VSSNSDSEITRILREVYAQNRQQMSAISIGNTERVFQDKPRLEIIQGYSFDQGFLSPYFTTDKAKSRVEYGSHEKELIAGAYVLLIDYPPESEGDLRRVLEFAHKLQKPIVLIAPDFRPDAFTSLVVNHL
jgi:chaperonin GroEL